MLLENMKFKLDAMNAIIQTLPQSTREIMGNADELIRRSGILVTVCNELYKEVKDVGAYIKCPTGLWALTGKDAAMYLSRHDYDSPLVMSSAAIPEQFKNIPMSIALQLNGLFVIPDAGYLTIKYYHDKDNLPVGAFWNRQIQENTLNYKNEHCTFPHIIAVSDVNFEKEIENFKKYAKVVIFEMASAIRAAEKAQRLDTIKEAGKDYVVT